IRVGDGLGQGRWRVRHFVRLLLRPLPLRHSVPHSPRSSWEELGEARPAGRASHRESCTSSTSSVKPPAWYPVSTVVANTMQVEKKTRARVEGLSDAKRTFTRPGE